jgi:hypothetical protein
MAEAKLDIHYDLTTVNGNCTDSATVKVRNKI